MVARMAAEHDLDLALIEGTGRDGRITKKDVEAYLDDPPAELRRCAGEHFYAVGLGLDGQPMPWVLEHGAVRSLLRDRRGNTRAVGDGVTAARLARHAAAAAARTPWPP